jgi:hypothetical protein
MGWKGPVTHWQFIVWQVWLEQEWNKPSRTDHYLMQLNATVRGLVSKDRTSLSDLQIKFQLPSDKADEKHKQQSSSSSQEVVLPADFWVPKRMTKEDVARANAMARLAQVQMVKAKKRTPPPGPPKDGSVSQVKPEQQKKLK